MRATVEAALAAAFLLACAAAAPARADCEFKKVGEMAVDMAHGQPRVQIEANGQTFWVTLATGQTYSALNKSAIKALGGGVNGQSQISTMNAQNRKTLDYATVRNVTFGGAFVVSSLDVLARDDSPSTSEVVGYLGDDILAGPDTEFDLAHNRVAFFSSKGCGSQSLAYWDGPITEAKLMGPRVPTQRSFQLTPIFFRPQVMLNGKPITAQLSSGLNFSIVDKSFADGQGLKTGAAGVTPVAGIQKPTLAAKFTSFEIGSEKISNPTLAVQDLWSDATSVQTGSSIRLQIDGLPTMMLGLDFMRAHRILVANSQQKMYFSYNGGAVFRPPAAR